MTIAAPFVVDAAGSDGQHLYVDITGIGTVLITVDADGIAVEIYPLQIADAPVAHAAASYAELMVPETAQGDKA